MSNELIKEYCDICTALLPNHTTYCSRFELVTAPMPILELEDPKLILEVIDKLTVQARCNKCKSDDIAVIIKRISLNER